MFLRCNRRVKDGKSHEYWSVVESRRLADGRVVQRQVLYLGEINASQREAWRKTIEVQDEGQRRQVALFPTGLMPADAVDAIGVRMSELRLERPRQWGACWLSCVLWRQLDLDRFWAPRLVPSREGTPWLLVLQTLVAYRLIDPGSEWRLHRQWFDASAMGDLLGADFALAEKNTLYRCLDKLAEHKDALFKFLVGRWGELFGAKFDVLLYDLTSTYFESDVERSDRDLRQYGYSRDKRGDCRQVEIALIVTPEGFPLSYEVLSGNTADSTTLGEFLDRIERRYGRADRIWVMDRGVPTEDSLTKMRSMGASYLVGTPKGRLNKLEQRFLGQAWASVRDGVQVKRLSVGDDMYVLAKSAARVDKERAMRRRRLGRYVQRLHALQGQALTRDRLLMKLGAAKQAGRTCGQPDQGQRRSRDSGHQDEPLRLRTGSLEAAPSASSRRPLSVANQSGGPRPGTVVDLLHPAHRGRAGVQGAQARLGGAPDLPLERTTHRSPHLRGLPGVLPAGQPKGATTRAGTRPHASRSNRQVQDDADGGCPRTHQRRTRTGAVSLYPARSGPSHAARPAAS